MTNQTNFHKYLAIETAAGARWHPTEKKIVFIYDAPGNFQVYSTKVVEGQTIWPTRHTFEINRCTDPRYLKDGSIIFQQDKDGDENFQIFCLNEDSTISRVTTDLKAKHIVLTVSENYIYFIANIENKTRFDVYRQKIPLKVNPAEKLFEAPSGVLPNSISLSPDEKKIVTELYFGNMSQELWLLEIENRKLTNLTEPICGKEKVRWKAVRWIDDNHILVLTDYKSDLKRLATISIDGQFYQIEEIEGKKNYEISIATWSKQSPYTFFIYNEDGYDVLYKGIFSTTSANELQRINLPIKGTIPFGDLRSFTQGIALSPDGTMLAITFSSPQSPTNVWIIQLETNKIWKATNASTGGLNPKYFIDASLEEFSSFDGLRVPYFRYIPQGSKPKNGWPAIFIIHGGPEAQMRPSFAPNIQFFLSAGLAVIAPNIRGSSGYGRRYLDLDNKEKRLDSIKDIKQLALHIKENDLEIDSEKLIIYGGSYGGFAVLSAMTEHPELWSAGVDIVGISNFVTYMKNTAPWRRKLREVEYGSLEEDLETLKRISPINQIDHISAPLFIIHGDNDERVPVSETIQIYEKLKEKRLDVELLRFTDEGHGITKLENKIKAFSQLIKWLKRII